MKKRNFLDFLKNKYFIIGLIIVVIALAYYYFTHRSSTTIFESTAATIGDVIERVSVTGTISPVNKADLAFEKSGVISRVYVKVGDTVRTGSLIASLDSAGDAAALASAQATLAELSRGLRPEELAVDQANLNSASTTLANAKKDAVNAVRDGYVKTQGAVVNYADTFFVNPQSANPTVNVSVQSSNIGTAINNERVLVSDILRKWKNDTDAIQLVDAPALVSSAEGYLTTVKAFMSDLSAIVNDLSPGNSGISQNAIDAAVTVMNSALSNMTQAINAISAADTELKNAVSAYAQAKNTFALQQAGSSPDTIAAQAAKVAQIQAQLSQDIITSPIDGIVTKADPNAGEFAAAGQSGFSVQNNGSKIEAYVPEADIAKIVVGDLASSTLDAYGSYVDFPARVSAIAPAETILEGVPTYKVTLYFITPDSRIRSGMTANMEILTHKAIGVLEIPYRAITVSATSTTVRLVSSDGKSYAAVPVTTGLKGSDGTIEVVSGLNPGDRVVTYVK